MVQSMLHVFSTLDFAMILSHEHLEAFYTYSTFKPQSFMRNVSYLKIIGLNQRKLCGRCFFHKKLKIIPGPRELCNREIGKTNKFFKTRAPLTQDDAYRWFEGFHEFLNRKDLDECIMENTPIQYTWASGCVLVI